MINLESLGLESLRRDENQHDHSSCLMIDIEHLGLQGWKWILEYFLVACCYLDIETLRNMMRLRWYALLFDEPGVCLGITETNIQKTHQTSEN